MWTRRKPATTGPATPAVAGGGDSVSLLEYYFPMAIEEHPAKRRIRRANEVADAMRQTGGRHRSEEE